MKRFYFYALISIVTLTLLTACKLSVQEDDDSSYQTLNGGDDMANSENFGEESDVSSDAVISEDISEKIILTGHADFKYYETREELLQASDYVIQGKILKCNGSKSVNLFKSSPDENSENDENLDMIVTTYQVYVEKDFLGDLGEGSELTLYVLGGETDEAIYIYEDDFNPNLEMEYVLFLRKSLKWENSVWVVGGNQGAFETSDGEIINLELEQFLLEMKEQAE